MWLMDLIAAIMGMPAKPAKPQKPAVTSLVTSWGVISAELDAMGMNILYGALDAPDAYYSTDLTGWQLVLDYIYKVYKFPEYDPNRMDCEDFALLLKALVQAEFGLNTIGFTIGTMPQGVHGFNIIRTEQGWRYVEPQPAFGRPVPFTMGERGYDADYILI